MCKNMENEATIKKLKSENKELKKEEVLEGLKKQPVLNSYLYTTKLYVI